MAKPCYFKNEKDEVTFIIDASEVEAVIPIKDIELPDGLEEVKNGFWKRLFGLPTRLVFKTKKDNLTRVVMKSGHNYDFLESFGYTFENVKNTLGL